MSGRVQYRSACVVISPRAEIQSPSSARTVLVLCVASQHRVFSTNCHSPRCSQPSQNLQRYLSLLRESGLVILYAFSTMSGDKSTAPPRLHDEDVKRIAEHVATLIRSDKNPARSLEEPSTARREDKGAFSVWP